jgi:hypothetical protein
MHSRCVSRIYGNHSIVQSVNPCSDILICLSPKSHANEFLHYLRCQYRLQIFFTNISIQPNDHRWSDDIFERYDSETARYALAMCHSLGYVFDDKYLFDARLQHRMMQCAIDDEHAFYQLVQRAIIELNKCHWLDLTAFFIRQETNRIKQVKQETPTRQSIRSRSMQCFRMKKHSYVLLPLI